MQKDRRQRLYTHAEPIFPTSRRQNIYRRWHRKKTRRRIDICTKHVLYTVYCIEPAQFVRRLFSLHIFGSRVIVIRFSYYYTGLNFILQETGRHLRCEQTDTQTDAGERFTPATIFGVSKKEKRSWICIAPHCEKLASEALRYHGSHSCYTANSPYPPLPSSIHQMAPPV